MRNPTTYAVFPNDEQEYSLNIKSFWFSSLFFMSWFWAADPALETSSYIYERFFFSFFCSAENLFELRKPYTSRCFSILLGIQYRNVLCIELIFYVARIRYSWVYNILYCIQDCEMLFTIHKSLNNFGVECSKMLNVNFAIKAVLFKSIRCTLNVTRAVSILSIPFHHHKVPHFMSVLQQGVHVQYESS